MQVPRDIHAKTPGLYLDPELRYPCHCCRPCCCCRPCRCPPPHCPPPHHCHHHEADALDVLDVLAKTPYLYLVPKLRYPCHCCRHPCRCPPPRHHPSHLRHHHHHHLPVCMNGPKKVDRRFRSKILRPI